MSKIADVITNIIMFFMRGRIKQIDGLIEPELRKKVAESAKKLQESVDKYNESLNKPATKKFLEGSDRSIEDYRMKDL